ncbi:MAG: hypothetical protein KKF41_03210 [Actinobacteria bacterium]|nr:hypothetical protein [Actinomycetota bacterium]MBU1943304.1 hypothetical protein [Actinomycetota bacterium]MBU2686578.1 hypothetical protein [Actinomycetota bacterium]
MKTSDAALSQRRLATLMAITSGVVIPPGLVLSAVFAGWKGFAGALVGFAIASLNTVASLAIIKWSLKKPPEMIPWMLISSLWGRLAVLGLSLYLLTLISAFNKYTLVFCFLALFLAHSGVEVASAWSSARVVLRSTAKSSKKD